MAAFETVLSDTLDSDYVDPKFDPVITQLRAITGHEQAKARALADDMENKRAAALAHKKKLKDSLAEVPKAPTSAAPPPVSFNQNPAYPSDNVLVPSGAGRAPSETTRAAADDARITRELEATRRRQAAEEAQRARERARAEKIATQGKMLDRLEQKKEERMNEEWDESKWKCNYITGHCTSTVVVTEEEVKGN